MCKNISKNEEHSMLTAKWMKMTTTATTMTIHLQITKWEEKKSTMKKNRNFGAGVKNTAITTGIGGVS